MLASAEIPRPLPPAKARRTTTMLKLSSTPPPAYNSPLTFPSRRQSRQDILEEPNFDENEWDNDSAPSPSSLPLGEELLVSTEGERGPCSPDNVTMMTYLYTLSSPQNLTLHLTPRTCIIRMLRLSSRNMTLYYPNFPTLLHLLLMVHPICYPGL